MAETAAAETVIVLNPESGGGNHVTAVRARAEERNFSIWQTEAPGDAVTFAQEAAEAGASTIVSAGGDGTVNEVIHGIDRAAAFDEVTLGVLPLGTGNNFAKNIGITDLDSGFEVLKAGERRRIDVGRANGHLFMNSCVAGLTAESSDETSAEMKRRLGVVAYVITTLRSVSDYGGLHLSVEIDRNDTETVTWTGEAICVLVGNGRRFTLRGSAQANMEDGLLDVAVIEDVSALDLMSDTIIEQLFGQESAHLFRTLASSLAITVHDPESSRFSLDGEIIQQRELSVDTRPATLAIAVGDSYDPNPA